MRIAGLVAAGTGRRYGKWRHSQVASATDTSRIGYSNALSCCKEGDTLTLPDFQVWSYGQPTCHLCVYPCTPMFYNHTSGLRCPFKIWTCGWEMFQKFILEFSNTQLLHACAIYSNVDELTYCHGKLIMHIP